MLPENENEFMRRIMAPEAMEMPSGLAARIVAHATAQPQKVGLFGFLTRAFSEWDYALNVKGAALAAFAVLGLLSAQLGALPHRSLDPAAVMLADPNWTEEL